MIIFSVIQLMGQSDENDQKKFKTKKKKRWGDRNETCTFYTREDSYKGLKKKKNILKRR